MGSSCWCDEHVIEEEKDLGTVIILGLTFELSERLKKDMLKGKRLRVTEEGEKISKMRNQRMHGFSG